MLRRVLPAIALSDDIRLNSRDSQELFSDICRSTLAAASEVIETYDPYTWLWYLRRLPDGLMHTAHATSEEHDRLAAVSFAGTSHVPPDSQVIDYGLHEPLPIDREHLEPVLELLMMTMTLVEAQIQARRAAKGNQYITVADAFPRQVADPEIDASIQLYDDRVTELLGGTRVAGFDVLHRGRQASREGVLLALGVRAEGWGRVTGWEGPAARPLVKWEQDGRYMPATLTLRNLPTVGGTKTGSSLHRDTRLPALTTMMKALALDVAFEGWLYPAAGHDLPGCWLPTCTPRETDLKHGQSSAALPGSIGSHLW